MDVESASHCGLRGGQRNCRFRIGVYIDDILRRRICFGTIQDSSLSWNILGFEASGLPGSGVLVNDPRWWYRFMAGTNLENNIGLFGNVRRIVLRQ